MKKRISMIAAAVAALAANAAPAAADTWNGPYVGAHTGYGSGDVDQPWGLVGGALTSPQNSPEVDGWIYGIQGGYNWTVGGSWVLGGELQATWGDREGDDGGSGGDVNGVDIGTEWSLRGRAGYLITPTILLYGTAGYVSMDVEASAPGGETPSETITGWTYGVGGEWAFNDTWSATLEWRTDEMDQERFSFPINNYDEGLTPNTSAIRVGANWHF
ncbi:MAG: porin family protein [Hyphomonadaceae bacterium]|nr:porin family protein [Hyphomonadaceae bacterium]